jgi:hypothetical protein
MQHWGKARLKLKYEAFVELNRHLVQYLYQHSETVSKWHGLNLLVVDGPLIQLPRIKKIAEHFGERELASQHFLKLLPEDLVLLDRGYPAYWLFNLILSLQANFCARISNKKWKIVKKFFNSGKGEKIISLQAYSTSIKMCRQMGLDLKLLKLRLIRIDLPTGETEILITSLIDKQQV